MEKQVIRTKSLIEQHFHGAYGVNFNTAKAEQIVELGQKLLKHGITVFYPTLHTDSIDNLKKQIAEIKQAQKDMPLNYAQIKGIHLEGPFINPDKKGIHPVSQIKTPSIEAFMELYDDIIKIVTLAPEMDKDHDLCRFLSMKRIKVSAGHTNTKDLTDITQVTHLFNAMDGVNHKEITTASLALIDDNISTEIICDGVHVVNPVLDMVFRCKPKDKILFISDCLPLAYSNQDSIEFCSEVIRFDNFKGVNEHGTLAGSTMLLDDIIRVAARTGTLGFSDAVEFASTNIAKNLSIQHDDHIYWDKFMNIDTVEIDGKTVFQA